MPPPENNLYEWNTNFNWFVFSSFNQNKFYTRRRIRVSQLAKVSTLFPDWWRSLN